ncbi:phage portal protein [Candidatus Pacearchaeota archaeon]|nr:phage portal protein [Candidatus Pacearchaeota archaeon]
MNFFQKARFTVANILLPNLKQLIKNQFNEAFLWGSGGFTQYDNKAPTYINQGYNINSIVYSIIKQQATKTSSIPYSIKRIEDKKSFNKLLQIKSATKGDYTTQQQVRKILLEHKAFTNEFIPFPMVRPNISQTWTEFIALYKTFLKLTGNVYMFILAPLEGPNVGKPIQVYLLPSHLIQIVIKSGTDMMSVESPVRGYILIQGKQFISFDAKNVIHIKYSNPNYNDDGSHLYGQSPLRAALRNMQSSNIALNMNIKTLKSGGAFGLIHGNKTAMTPDQAQEIKDRLLEMDASSENLSKISGVSADVGFIRLSLTSEELKPFDYLKFDRQQIADVLEWSIDDGNRGDFGGTINEIKKTRITDNIGPDLDLFANAINTEFLPRFKGYEETVIEFDYTELPEMQGDISKLVTWLKDALDRGVVTRNEFRLAINYIKSDDPNMDVHTVNTDILTLEEALEQDFNIQQ